MHTGEIECLERRMLSDVTPNASIASVRAFRSPVRWLGVFARDQLQDLRHIQRPFALVFNTDPSNKPGKHWLSIFGPNDGPLEFFNSFGMPPSYYGLTSSFTYLLISFQSYTSDMCINYTLYFIYYRSRNISFIKIISLIKFILVPDTHVKNYVLFFTKSILFN